MNRREFLRRSLAVAAALGLPGGVAVAAPSPVCSRCGIIHAPFDASVARERARMELACWFQQELDRLTAKALTE